MNNPVNFLETSFPFRNKSNTNLFLNKNVSQNSIFDNKNSPNNKTLLFLNNQPKKHNIQKINNSENFAYFLDTYNQSFNQLSDKLTSILQNRNFKFRNNKINKENTTTLLHHNKSTSYNGNFVNHNLNQKRNNIIQEQKILKNEYVNYISLSKKNHLNNISYYRIKANLKKINSNNKISENVRNLNDFNNVNNLSRNGVEGDLNNLLSVYKFNFINNENINNKKTPKQNINYDTIISFPKIIRNNSFKETKSSQKPFEKTKSVLSNINKKIENQIKRNKVYFSNGNTQRAKINKIKKIKIADFEKLKNNKIIFEAFSVPGSTKGISKINQDSYMVLSSINNSKNILVFGVFDGHGKYGDIISTEVRDYFIEYFNNNCKFNDENDSEEVKIQNFYNKITNNNFNEIYNIFNNLNSKLHKKNEQNNYYENSGTTTHIIIIINETKIKNYKIIAINVGDSNSILITNENKIIALNSCHVPDNEEEKIRIENNGGEIGRVDWANYGPQRIWYKGEQYPGLSVTRSFGDFISESLGVNSIPEIKEYNFYSKKCRMIVMSTDGIWEFLEYENAKDLLNRYYEENDIHGGIIKIIDTSTKLWKIKNPKYIDDLTTIIIFFK